MHYHLITHPYLSIISDFVDACNFTQSAIIDKRAPMKTKIVRDEHFLLGLLLLFLNVN
jgi:hypothetical protein